ncbi:hypothetical protein SK128_025955 [Halocaridina rubra]|uniref:Uncharacterized protein n=1 Tax=Halocaridina rubra TaxID=373956 RepID=A0AAN8WRQ4_HALRR
MRKSNSDEETTEEKDDKIQVMQYEKMEEGVDEEGWQEHEILERRRKNKKSRGKIGGKKREGEMGGEEDLRRRRSKSARMLKVRVFSPPWPSAKECTASSLCSTKPVPRNIGGGEEGQGRPFVGLRHFVTQNAFSH